MTFSTVRKNTLLASVAVTTLAFTLSTAAIAQDSDSDVIEDEVVATGIRQSIADSLKIKRDNTSIVEAITAEDIGKLPDVSIADSLARLPGVTAQRVRGRAQQIAIRGLGPDFSIALLNGREVVSAGNNRGIEFDQFPSELIAQGLVYKTPDARLAATGIAGAVDLRTLKPLDYSEDQFNVSGKYVINGNGSLNPDFADDGYRLFGSYIGQNSDKTVGWAFAVTDQSNPTQFVSRELKTQGTQTFNGVLISDENPRTGVVSRNFERTSVSGTLQFEPTDSFQVTADAFYSDFEDAGIFRGVETPTASWSGATPTAATGSGPFADTATYEDITVFTRTDTEGNEAEIAAFGINASYDVTQNLSVIFDYGKSSLDRKDIDYESYGGLGTRIVGCGDGVDDCDDLQDTITYTTPEDGDYSLRTTQDYTDPSTLLLTDPGGWGQVGFIRSPDVTDDLDQLRAEAEYEFDDSPISSVVAGFISTDRVKTFQDNAFFVRASDNFAQVTRNGDTGPELAVPTSAIVGVTDGSSTGIPILAYDPAALRTDGTYVEQRTSATAYRVEENVETLYAMANIDTQLAELPVRGNVGLQYVDTRQSSIGSDNTLGLDVIPGEAVEFEYDDWLPSANLSFELNEQTFIRAAFAKTLTRARLDQLAGNTNVSTNPNVCLDTDADQAPDVFIDGAFNPPDQTCLNFSGGNPFLNPYRSTSYDLAFEKYWGDTTALSLAVYNKDLNDYVQDTVAIVDGADLAVSLLGQDFVSANPNSTVIKVDGPSNVESGSIRGFEVAGRLGFGDFTDGPLSGFGINAAYNYADSEIDLGDGITSGIPGYSAHTASAEIYYEQNGFRGRINGRHRSGFISEIQQFDGNLDPQRALSETILDAQVGYEWEEGKLEGLSVNFEVYNITDEPFRTVQDIGNGNTFVSRHEQYGTTYNFTVAKKF